MAKMKRDQDLYSKMRDHGLRKSVARQLSELPAHVSNGKQAPKPLREAVERLEGLVEELKRHTGRGDRQVAARKAARTRSENAASRSSAARKAARTRAEASRRGRATGSTKPRSSSAGTKSRSGGSTAKRRTQASN
jgi:hemerythrin-like domain-containing protein